MASLEIKLQMEERNIGKSVLKNLTECQSN